MAEKRINRNEVSAEYDTHNNVLRQRIEATDALISAVSSYINDTELQGEAYTSSKEFMANHYLPMFRGMISACSEMRNANDRLKGHLSILYTDDINVPRTDELRRAQRLKQERDTERAEQLARLPGAQSHRLLITALRTSARIAGTIADECETALRSVDQFELTTKNLYSASDALFEHVERTQALLANVTFCEKTNTYSNITVELVESSEALWINYVYQQIMFFYDDIIEYGRPSLVNLMDLYRTTKSPVFLLQIIDIITNIYAGQDIHSIPISVRRLLVTAYEAFNPINASLMDDALVKLRTEGHGTDVLNIKFITYTSYQGRSHQMHTYRNFNRVYKKK